MKQEDGGKSGDKSGEKPAADKAKEEGGIAAAAAAALGAAAVKVGFVDGCGVVTTVICHDLALVISRSII